MDKVFTHRKLIRELMDRGLVERISVEPNGYKYLYKLLLPK